MSMQLHEEIDRNFDFFQRHLAEFLPEHEGKYVLLHECKPVDFFDDLRAAEEEGAARFADQAFSIQEVTASVMDLGFFSYAHRQG